LTKENSGRREKLRKTTETDNTRRTANRMDRNNVFDRVDVFRKNRKGGREALKKGEET